MPVRDPHDFEELAREVLENPVARAAAVANRRARTNPLSREFVNLPPLPVTQHIPRQSMACFHVHGVYLDPDTHRVPEQYSGADDGAAIAAETAEPWQVPDGDDIEILHTEF